MSYTQEIRRNARKIRDRLRRPPNAVPDTGINTTRISSGVKGEHISPVERVEITQKTEANPEPVLPQPAPIPGVSPDVELPLTFNRIMTVVASHYGLSVANLKSAYRGKETSHARRISIYLGTKLTDRTISSMARELQKDHTSVIYARDMMIKNLSNNIDLSATVNKLHEELLGEYHVQPTVSAVSERYVPEQQGTWEGAYSVSSLPGLEDRGGLAAKGPENQAV